MRVYRLAALAVGALIAARRVSADPVAKPAAQTRAESRVLDLRKLQRERDRLSAGGRWIRTSSSGASGEADAILPVKDRPRPGEARAARQSKT
jgi:hypothetical protein